MAPRRRNPSRAGSSSSTGSFWDKDFEARYNENVDRTIMPGMSISYAFLRENGFNTIIEDLQYQGWGNFISFFHSVDSMLLRQFYINLKLVPTIEESYISLANGMQVSLNTSDLHAFLCSLSSSHDDEQPSLEGVCFDGSSIAENRPDYNYNDALSFLHDPESTKPTSPSVAELSTENRMLHHIVTHIISPRSGSFSVVSDYDASIMFLLRHRIKISLPSIMMYLITRSARSKSYHFPYGMFLTAYLVNFCGAPQIPHDSLNPDLSKVQYTRKSLSLLFRYDNGSWTRRYGLDSVGTSSSAQPPPPTSPVLPPPTTDHTEEPDSIPEPASHSFDPFDHIHFDSPNPFDLQRSLSRLEQKQDAFETSMTKMQGNMDRMQGSLDRLEHNFEMFFNHFGYWNRPGQGGNGVTEDDGAAGVGEDTGDGAADGNGGDGDRYDIY